MIGWGVAQWPYILPESLEVADAAAPSGTLNALLVATVAAVVIVLPGFILLYVLDQRSLLPEEGVPSGGRWRTGLSDGTPRSRRRPTTTTSRAVRSERRFRRCRQRIDGSAWADVLAKTGQRSA